MAGSAPAASPRACPTANDDEVARIRKRSHSSAANCAARSAAIYYTSNEVARHPEESVRGSYQRSQKEAKATKSYGLVNCASSGFAIGKQVEW